MQIKKNQLVRVRAAPYHFFSDKQVCRVIDFNSDLTAALLVEEPSLRTQSVMLKDLKPL